MAELTDIVTNAILIIFFVVILNFSMLYLYNNTDFFQPFSFIYEQEDKDVNEYGTETPEYYGYPVGGTPIDLYLKTVYDDVRYAEFDDDNNFLINTNLNVSKNITSNNVKVTNNVNVTGNITTDYADTKTYVAKYHNNLTIDTDTAMVWQNISFNVIVDEETTTGFNLTDNNFTIVTSFSGIVRVSGCIHFINNEGSNLNARVGVRTLKDDIEMRCTQNSDQFVRASGGVEGLRYGGTLDVVPGSRINLQYYVGDTGIDLEGDPIFDRPVSASINLEKISNFN